MTDQTSTTTRRSVLRSAIAGGAAAVGLGATGTAGASSFQDGDCVRTVTSVQLWG